MTQQTAKLFKNGRSQAVRLPLGFRFEGQEVYIQRDGDKVILSPKPVSWDDFFLNAPQVSADFMAERSDGPAQEREPLA